MASSRLQLELERANLTFRPQETIRGRVLVHASDACRCDKLTIALQWRTHGKGNVAKGSAQTLVLFVGEWQAGASHAYPFELTAPAGPCTYRGSLLNVDWYLTARADVPWAFDPKVETELLLQPWTEPQPPPTGPQGYRAAPAAPSAPYDFGPEAVLPEQALARQAGGSRVVAVVGLLLLVGAAIAFVSGASPAGVMLLIFAAFPLGSYGWKWLARRSLGGTPRICIEPPTVEAGQRLDVTVSFAPTKTTVLESAQAVLTAAEIVVRGSGTDKQTFTHQLHAEPRLLAEPGRTIGSFEHTELSASFLVPAGAPPTFAASDNQLRWSIEVTVDAQGAPAWKQDVPFLVRPGAPRPG